MNTSAAQQSPQSSVLGTPRGAAVMFRSEPVPTLSPQIDRENLIMRNLIMAKPGPAKGHGFSVDAEFMKDLVDDVNAHMKKGVKSYFGHNLWSRLGSKLGHYKNVKLGENATVLGDLHFMKAANASPTMPNQVDYVMEMAEEDKSSIMNSIVFQPKAYFQKDGSKKVYVQPDYWNGGFRKEFSDREVFAEYGGIKSCDVEDEGAITESMFSTTDTHMHTHQQHPSPIEQFISFCNGLLGLNKSQPMQESNSQQPPSTPPVVAQDDKVAASSQQPAANSQISLESLAAQVQKLQADHTAALAAKDQKITELEAKVKQLGKGPSDEPTGGKTGDEALGANEYEKILMQDPVNAKAMKAFGHFPRKK